VPAGLVQVYMEREARAVRTVQLGEQAMRLARLVAEQQIRTFEGARQVLAAMTAHEAVRALVPSPECDAFMRSIVQAVPRYVTTTVLDREGDLVCSGRRQAFSSNSANQPYFRQALADRGFSIGVYSVGRRSGEPSIHLSMPLLDEAGEVRGVVAVALSIEWLVRDLQGLALPPGSSATLADRNGVVLARSLSRSASWASRWRPSRWSSCAARNPASATPRRLTGCGASPPISPCRRNRRACSSPSAWSRRKRWPPPPGRSGARRC
jgi:C4-dicarboxylate-specific signal transduction histidine kinase